MTLDNRGVFETLGLIALAGVVIALMAQGYKEYRCVSRRIRLSGTGRLRWSCSGSFVRMIPAGRVLLRLMRRRDAVYAATSITSSSGRWREIRRVVTRAQVD